MTSILLSTLLLVSARPCSSLLPPLLRSEPSVALASRISNGAASVRMMSSASSGDGAPTPTTTPRRIFCYGDSLTAGTSPPSDALFPYAPHLEKGLLEHGHSCVVRWRGLPGWTASAMVDYMDDSTYGLRSALNGIRDPSLSLVIILAGTNDVGSLTSSYAFGGGGGSVDASAAIDPILRLHRACLDTEGDGGARSIRTVAVGVPGSAWQEMNSDAARLCSEINDALRKFAESEDRTTYVDFPFEFERGGKNWCGDGLHFSPEGYEELGRALVPFVRGILDGLRA